MIIQIPLPPNPPPPPPGLPIDSGIILLAFIGLIYGALVIKYGNKKEKNRRKYFYNKSNKQF